MSSRPLCCLLLALLCGCAAEEERPVAREVGGYGSFAEAEHQRRATGGPAVPRLEPKTVRAFPEKPTKPPWKGPTRRALDLDPGARAEVEATQDRNRRSVVRVSRRQRVKQRARRKAAERFDARLDREVRRRAELLVEKRAAWKKLAPKRIAAYLAEARKRAGGAKARAIELVRCSKTLRDAAAVQAQASEELRAEAERTAKRKRRYLKVTYVQGLKIPEAAGEAETAERRLTEITLIAAYAELEASWARAAYAKHVAVWERYLARSSR